MKEYLENRIKSLSVRLEELYKEYDSATGAAKTAIAYRNCNLVEERLAELNDALKHYTEQFNKHGVMQGLADFTKEDKDKIVEASIQAASLPLIYACIALDLDNGITSKVVNEAGGIYELSFKIIAKPTVGKAGGNASVRDGK